MDEGSRPGPKPRRLFVRVCRVGDADRSELPPARRIGSFVRELERVGRLVAHGTMVRPAGDLLIVRAGGMGEAERSLRNDPFRSVPGSAYELLEWSPREAGGGVNLEPPPARGSGRLTSLQRVTVVVRDQAQALAWYRDVLGLAVREHEPETGYVELSLGRGAAALSLVAPRREWGEPYYSEAMERIGQRTGIAFETDSIPALRLRLEHERVRITEAPQAQPWGGVTLRFADPDGNEFLAFQRGRPPQRPRIRPTAPDVRPAGRRAG